MLSRSRISVPQCMQAERGLTTERPSGSRAATTFRKLPIASPGAKTTAARAKFTIVVSADAACALSRSGNARRVPQSDRVTQAERVGGARGRVHSERDGELR